MNKFLDMHNIPRLNQEEVQDTNSPNTRSEIESVIENKFPSIEQCAVFSIENEEIEEEIVLVYSGNSELNSSEILFELKNHLASYMLPSKIIYKKSLPLIPSDKNKINKEELKKELKSK